MIKKKSDQQLIVQALNAAETNIRLAKTLLSGAVAAPQKPPTKDLPGITGTFDGENMIAEDGKKYSVNPNYASKSVLVYGDTLKRIEVDGQERFKQIARVKRQKVEGILAKKAGRWTAVTADGSYKISPVAVEFHKGEEGNEVVVVIPVEERNAPYAALESVKKDEPEKKVTAIKKTVKKTTVAKKKAPTKKKAVIKKKVEKEPSSSSSSRSELGSGTVGKAAPEPAEVENDEELR